MRHIRTIGARPMRSHARAIGRACARYSPLRAVQSPAPIHDTNAMVHPRDRRCIRPIHTAERMRRTNAPKSPMDRTRDVRCEFSSQRIPNTKHGLRAQARRCRRVGPVGGPMTCLTAPRLSSDRRSTVMVWNARWIVPNSGMRSCCLAARAVFTAPLIGTVALGARTAAIVSHSVVRLCES